MARSNLPGNILRSPGSGRLLEQVLKANQERRKIQDASVATGEAGVDTSADLFTQNLLGEMGAVDTGSFKKDEEIRQEMLRDRSGLFKMKDLNPAMKAFRKADVTQEQVEYDITQRGLQEDIKRQEYETAQQTFKESAAEEARKKADYDYRTTTERIIKEEKGKRTAKIEEIEHTKKLKVAESTTRINEMFTDDLTAEEFNEAHRLHKNQGFKDPEGRLKARANRNANAAVSTITQASIGNQVELENTADYTRAKYNSIINDEFIRLKALHPYADESILIKKAHDAVARTEAGTFFQEQEWFEEQTRAGKDVEIQRARKVTIKKTWGDAIRQTTSSYNAMNANRTRYSSEDFRAKISQLNNQFADHQDDLPQSAKNQLKTWTNRAIVDYTQNDFKPTQSYIKSFQRTFTDPETNQVHNIPLGLPDYSPTNQREFIDQEIKKLTEEFPLAEIADIEKAVITKIQKSGLSVKFAQGALPAKLQAARDQFRYETALNRSDRRAEVTQGIDNSEGKSLHSYTYSVLFKKFADEGHALGTTQANKLSTELTKTITQWKSWIPGWDKLGIKAKETYNIAMHNILSGAQVDPDWNFLMLDPNDYALSNVAGASSTGDMSGVKKNAILTALIGKISPYGTPEGQSVPNSDLITDLEKAVTAFNDKAVADRKKARDKAMTSGYFQG